MLIKPMKFERMLAVRFNAGEDILEKLEEVVRREKLQNATILTGVGSVNSYHYHVVSTRELPPENAFVKGDDALDIVNINGVILEGRVHAHITLSNTQHALGGHMEPGCRVLTFAVAVIGVASEPDFTGWDSFDIMNG